MERSHVHFYESQGSPRPLPASEEAEGVLDMKCQDEGRRLHRSAPIGRDSARQRRCKHRSACDTSPGMR